MPTNRTSRTVAGRAGKYFIGSIFLLAAVLLAACSSMESAESGRSAAASPPRTAMPLDAAVLSLADATLRRANLPRPGSSGRYRLTIDPLIDRATGAETAATRAMGNRIGELIRERYPQYELRPFASAVLDERPLVLLGSITGVTEAGGMTNATGPGRPPAYRIWAVLADLASGQVISHETTWVKSETVDPVPAAFFRDSPVWTPDDAAAAYLRTCALNPGDPIDPAYIRTIRVQALVADAIRAYENSRFVEALGFYNEASQLAPANQQLRIRNGIYLANQALGRAREAEAAFGAVVDYGLERGRLAVKFVFQPRSAAFWPDPAISGPYRMWLRQIAARTTERPVCLVVEGHSSPTGSVIVNQRLSRERAERIQARLIAERPVLRPRIVAEGVGSARPIVGTGADDASDVLDRRVEFEPRACPVATASSGS
jgi:outer membrane protein OmpA-like peptidoglycan-associated protein